MYNSVTTHESLPSGSVLLRIYNGLPEDKCCSPAPYKFFTVILPPIDGYCELKGGNNTDIRLHDFKSILITAKNLFVDVRGIKWLHRDEMRYLPKRKL
jgi:hypothetical protein